MIDPNLKINNATKILLAELSQRDDVLGVILFGSWARGNPRPNSDVDLMIIYSGEYQKSIQSQNEQIFEIIYTNQIEVMKFWESHPDDAIDFWAIAKVLFDKKDTIQRLKHRIQSILDVGKKSLTANELKELHFDAQDQLNFVASNIINSNSETQNINYFPSSLSPKNTSFGTDERNNCLRAENIKAKLFSLPIEFCVRRRSPNALTEWKYTRV